MAEDPICPAEKPSIEVQNLVVIYNDRGRKVVAVDDVSLTVPEHSFYTLLGPSGCGKTSMLRCIAGLEPCASGRIRIGAETVVSHEPPAFVPPHKRDIGMVFQSYAIWPHLNVFENVAFPLRILPNRISRSTINRRVEAALATVRLDGFAARMPTQLSGGQQQRLALARALVREPTVLLLDEPLSNLDAKLRDEMRIELREIQKRLGITTVYVTHDQSEALAMSDRIAVMADGRIVQEGSPQEIYRSPASPFVATFVGGANLLAGEVGDDGERKVRVRLGIKTLEFASQQPERGPGPVLVSVRPEDIRLHLGKPPNLVNVAGVVESAVYLGECFEFRVRIGEQAVLARLKPERDIVPGDHVFVEFDPTLCSILDEQMPSDVRVAAS